MASVTSYDEFMAAYYAAREAEDNDALPVIELFTLPTLTDWEAKRWLVLS